jgi:hypothetical protein
MKKFHDDMWVKLRNGVEIKGLRLDSAGDACLDPSSSGTIYWMPDGRIYGLINETDLDIVEVLSEAPKRYLHDMKLEDLKEGMEFMPEGGRIHGGAFCFSVRAFTNGSLVMQYMYVVGKSGLAFIDEDLLEELGKLDLYLDGGE